MILPSDFLRSEQPGSPLSQHAPSQQLLPTQGSNLQVALPPPQKSEPQSSPVASREGIALAQALQLRVMFKLSMKLKSDIDASIREITHSPTHRQKIYEALAKGQNIDELTSLIK
ncbi:hypothetical protein MRS44_003771 [Fusarium solani]|uniref:uncharacterized protein n=1 Tax=Fusarium solani TaxID=169388 RepID=UPI0032C423B8|nr:hypothetical protein MRS44_003771 [Fusarium solani]